MAEEGKGVALAILGIVAVIAVVGLVLLFKGGAGKVSYGGGPFIQEPADRLCNNIQCENGEGGIVVGETPTHWICACPHNFQAQHIADWSNQWRGDDAHGSRPFYADSALLVSKVREY